MQTPDCPHPAPRTPAPAPHSPRDLSSPGRPGCPSGRRGRRSTVILATLALGASVLLGAGPAQAEPAAPKPDASTPAAPTSAAPQPSGPQLSIAVDNGQTSVTAGQELDYAITVTNLGGKTVRELRLSQTLPAGATFVSADEDGTHAKGVVSWEVKVKPSDKATVHVTLEAPKAPPQDLLRLATVACAQVTTKGPPLVCASDSDQLPAGAAAERAAAEARPPDPADGAAPLSRTVLLAGGAVGLLALVGATGLLLRRRRSAAGVDGTD